MQCGSAQLTLNATGPVKDLSMPEGMCVHCAKRQQCGFRQPGTWIVECGLFVQDVADANMSSGQGSPMASRLRRVFAGQPVSDARVSSPKEA